MKPMHTPTASCAPHDTKPAPVALASRIEDVDVIRGVALFGILVMNLIYGFRIPFPFVYPLEPDPALTDRIVSSVLTVLVAGKAMTLFSLLFGVGLCIFFERASARGPGATGLLARRLLVLMAFGFAHLLFLWHGDILMSYAASGLIAILLIRQRPAIWLTLAVALLGGRALIYWLWPTVLPPSSAATVAEHYQDALATYGGGTYLEVLVFRAAEIRDLFLPFSFTHMPTELSNFLIGMWVWRSGVLRQVTRYRRVLVWIAAAGIATGASFAIIRVIPGGMALLPHLPGELFYVVNSVFLRMFALGYGALLLLLLQRPGARAKLLRFAPLGQMAFTNYLTQSIVFSTIFYGYGFGLLGKLGTAAATLLGIALYVLQGGVSALWLRRFMFGPFEWAWRSLTYGQLQPMRRLPPAM